MLARHREPSGRFASRSRFQIGGSVDERGCRRDIRSNGWIELSKGSGALSKTGPAEETGFLRSVRIFLAPQFHRASKPQVKSGPDVFADALVHRGRLGSLAGAAAPGDLFPKSSITVISDHPGFTARRVQGVLRSRCSDGYRFAKWQGKPNSARRRKPPRNKHSHHLRRVACGIRLRRIHRNT